MADVCISDLAPISSLQYMLILDVSHNKLTKLLDFTPPKNLREANFGYNEIEEMTDLSAYHYISSLNLDRILLMFIFSTVDIINSME